MPDVSRFGGSGIDPMPDEYVTIHDHGNEVMLPLVGTCEQMALLAACKLGVTVGFRDNARLAFGERGINRDENLVPGARYGLVVIGGTV